MIFLVLESSAVTQPMSVRGYRFCARALPPGQTPVSDSPSPLWPEFQRRPHRPGDVALSRLSGWAESSVPSRGPAGLGEVRVGQCCRVVVTCGGLSVHAVTPASVVTPAPVQPPRCCGPRVLCHEDRGPGVLRTRSPFRPRQPARGDLGPAPGLAPPGTLTPHPRSPRGPPRLAPCNWLGRVTVLKAAIPTPLAGDAGCARAPRGPARLPPPPSAARRSWRGRACHGRDRRPGQLA